VILRDSSEKQHLRIPFKEGESCRHFSNDKWKCKIKDPEKMQTRRFGTGNSSRTATQLFLLKFKPAGL